MTGLFLRFYLGVIAILVGAWLIQGYVLSQSSRSKNIRVIEDALSGGARLAQQRLAQAPPDRRHEALAEIQARFAYPIAIVNRADLDLSDTARQRLNRGEVVLYRHHVGIRLPGETEALELGPLPMLVGPSQTAVSLGLGAVFLLAAIAIAILLRPVASQLRAVERTATAIAEGNLSARIERGVGPRGLPLAMAFNSMADRVETLLRTQRELLQAVSHELRTPLSRIRFAIGLIETAKTPAEARTRLEAVDIATQQLDDLVSELLVYVRLQSNAPVYQPEPIELQEMLAETLEMQAPLFPGIKFVFEPDPPTARHTLTADRANLSLAVGNLLRNAGRHAEQRVTVRASWRDQEVIIEVDDDGDGIDVDDRERVFEPFVRLDGSCEHGAGLGLALVHRIVARHGGRVSVSTSPLGGARFSLAFPRA